MKKLILMCFTVVLLTACGSSKSGKAIAEEVCDCTAKANALPAADPNRSKAQNDCMASQQKAWAEVKDNKEKSDDFNKKLSECSSEQIKKASGQ